MTHPPHDRSSVAQSDHGKPARPRLDQRLPDRGEIDERPGYELVDPQLVVGAECEASSSEDEVRYLLVDG